MNIINRYELKISINCKMKQQVLQLASSWLKADEHGDNNAQYPIHSLYFDSPDFECYWEKQDGVDIRRKIRLRYYPLSFEIKDWVFFLECKHRINQCVYKKRLKLDNSQGSKILKDFRHLHDLKNSSSTVPEEVVLAINAKSYHPVLITSYIREAWTGKEDPSLRLTFDHYISASKPGNFDTSPLSGNNLATDAGVIVMEVKFNNVIPCWIREIIAILGLRVQRFSKYAVGVDSLMLI